jgi:hypothetical protein
MCELTELPSLATAAAAAAAVSCTAATTTAAAEFIQLLSTEANELATKHHKSTITPGEDQKTNCLETTAAAFIKAEGCRASQASSSRQQQAQHGGLV